MLCQGAYTDDQENTGANFMNQTNWKFIRQFVTDKYRRCVGNHHPDGSTHHHPKHTVKTCCQCHCRNLGFITNFSQEEQHKSRTKHAVLLPFIDTVVFIPNSSGISIQIAIPIKPTDTIHSRISGPITVVTHCPRAAERPWLIRVASKIAIKIGVGLRKRAARSKASNWVLSPISASATMAVESRNSYIRSFSGWHFLPMIYPSRQPKSAEW